MSSNVKIRVKVGIGEVEIESPIDSLDKVIDSIPSLLDRISSALASIPIINNSINSSSSNIIGINYPQQSNNPSLLQASMYETYNESTVPDIRIEKGDSLSDIILKIFKCPWGRNARRLADVKRVLEHYGLSYPKQSVAVTLLRLAQHGKLRRFKGPDNEFVYTASTDLLTDASNNGSREEVMGAL